MKTKGKVSRMVDILEMAASIKNTQDSIDTILKLGTLKIDRKNLITGDKQKWFIQGIYSDEDCSVAMGVFPGIPGTQDSISIPHLHENNKEYLIGVKGSFSLFINGKFARTIKVGDVAAINSGDVHYSIPLEQNAKALAICVPADEIYKDVFKND